MSHIIQNWDELAVTPQREHALQILEAGIEAVETKAALHRKVRLEGTNLYVGERSYDLSYFHNVYVVSIGKAALEATMALETIIGDYISDGICLDVRSGALRHVKSIAGTHPLPSVPNMQAAEQIMNMLKRVTKNDLVITIISGGGSALLCLPYEVSCKELASITETMMKKGATIHELNTVRKHLSEIQGGQLVATARAATIIGLIYSDIPGDDLSMVASGPTFLDTTTVVDAEHILEKYDVLTTCRIEGCDLRETPKDPRLFAKVHNELIVSNTIATDAMMKKAETLGYRSALYSTTVNGEAGEVGKVLASLPRPGEAFVAAGETTIDMSKKLGKGGRNLEVSLGALTKNLPNILVISFASDGIDYVPVAGGIADGVTLQRAEAQNLHPSDYLRDHQSYDFFERTQSLIKTGIIGSNVSDVMVVLG